MKSTYLLTTLFGLWLCVAVFAGKIDIAESDNRVTIPGVITLSAEWVKDKGKKFDVHFKMKNEHGRPIIVLLKEMQCFRGDLQGELAHTFFNTGERTIDFSAGQLKSFNLVCQLGEKAKGGEYRIVVGNVYENASGDGKSIGKTLHKDVSWKVRIAD